MTKEMILLRGKPEESYAGFKVRALKLAERVEKTCRTGALKLTLTLEKPPALSVIPFSRNKVAMYSLYDSEPEAKDLILKEEDVAGAYLVEEALPVRYEKTWEDGECTPGICLLTLFHQKPELGREEFISRWHDGHTPLSLRIHPLWNYNRNVVLRSSKEGSEPFDGLVEEHFREASDLLNPFTFFGPLHRVPRHMAMVLKDSRSFIDMKRMETYLASEIHIRS